MNIRELIPTLESIAPPALAEDFDTGRIGLVLDRAASVTVTIGVVHPYDILKPE